MLSGKLYSEGYQWSCLEEANINNDLSFILKIWSIPFPTIIMLFLLLFLFDSLCLGCACPAFHNWGYMYFVACQLSD
ncbi:hypothetical protein DUNSADRAFT_8713 [Dunaliella salina]|uniref:Uncharacterized protein n=1 Tax=Dunaliella salina TaxID=3046 RepID=A0ABQ7GJ04_DUNSA|nr:hypothetical protein DUNSADRAFT_8713 [Dunaliella salina]|eukprot:KAF5834588.1 hypothetical protein DUNSADRAFT_8713 [Dunaliella salina]